MLGLLGFALLAYGLFGQGCRRPQILLLMGFGTLFVFFGVAFFSSQLVARSPHVLGGPAAALGGRARRARARELACATPSGTASTAAALMIGLALVTLVAMLAAWHPRVVLRRGQQDLADRLRRHGAEQLLADPVASRTLRNAPGSTQVVGVRAGEARFLGATHPSTAVDPGASQVFNLDWIHGSQAALDTLGATAPSSTRTSRRTTT